MAIEDELFDELAEINNLPSYAEFFDAFQRIEH